MSEIPYFFETPVPKYFRETGWFKTPNMILFVTWAFSKCSIQARTIVHDCKEINLSPYEFITGRGKSSKDSLLSEDAFKHQLNTLLKAGLLKKTHNSAPNRYTCYVWLTERFSKHNTQLNTQLSANSTPAERPQSRRKNERYKKDHHPYPSKKIVAMTDDVLDGLTDDLLFSNQEEKAKTEIYPGIFFTQEELNACIAVKGSVESVKEAIDFIMKSPRRKNKIHDWPNALTKWQVKPDIKLQLKENEKLAKYLSKIYDSFEKGNGYECRLYHNKQKDEKGLLFQPESSYIETFFISFIDPQFKDKALNYITEKNINKLKQKISKQN